MAAKIPPSDCCVCLTEIIPSEVVTCGNPAEKHTTGLDCAQAHFTNEASNGKIPVCPGFGCDYRFESPVIDTIMTTIPSRTGVAPPPAVLTRILELLARQDLVGNPNMRQCPYPGCDQWIDVGRPNTRSNRGMRVVCINHDGEATFCGNITCRLYPYHRETTSCAVALQTRARWTLWMNAIIALNNAQRPGTQYFTSPPRKPGAEVPPTIGEVPSAFRGFIARNRAACIAAFRGAGVPLPRDLELAAFPRIFNDLMVLADVVDRSINEGPLAVTVNTAAIQMQADEQWKIDNCKRCPNCGRVINKLDGCDAMVCGRDTHPAPGVIPQDGCGTAFSWLAAPAYVSDLTAEFSIRDGLAAVNAEPDVPAPERELRLGTGMLSSRCTECLQFRPTVFLCLTCTTNVVLCFHCVRAGLGSRPNAAHFLDRARRYNPATTLPHSHLHSFRVYTPAGTQVGAGVLTTPAILALPSP